MEPSCEWQPPKVSELPRWPVHGRVGIDTETRDEQIKKLGIGVRRGGYMAGVSFAVEDGPSNYLPIRHEGGDNLSEDHVLEYLRDQAASFRGTLVGANLGYDLDYLAHRGVVFHRDVRHRDVQIAEPLIDELQDEYSLEAICKRHGLPGKDEELLRKAAEDWHVHPKLGLWKLPGRFVAKYAIGDAQRPLQLLRRQERIIDEQGLWPIYDLESRILPVLVRMRRRGVRVDFDRLEQIERWSLAEEAKALDLLYQEIGVRVAVGDVWESAPIAKALEAAGVELPRTAKSDKPSVKDEVLEDLDIPAAKHIRRARKVNKVRTTFVKSLRVHAIGDRIHGTLNQLRRTKDDESGDERGARFGRLSSTDPNLQQQPGRDPEIGPMWRAVYVPDEGKLWAALDYSQQEPRMLLHYAELCGCTKAKEAADRFRDDPTTDNHTLMAQMVFHCEVPTKKQRSDAKQIYLGLSYVMGPAKLCKKLKLETKWITSRKTGKLIEVAGEEGEALFNQFHAGAPFIRELTKLCELRAERRGYVVTLLGRRCRFPMKKDGSGRDWTHKALNRIVQGSSADQTKKAMVEADAAGHELQLQIHDELDLSVRDRAEAEAVADIMRTCLPLSVPSKVSVEVGPNWGMK